MLYDVDYTGGSGIFISEFERGYMKGLDDSGVRAVEIAHRMQIALSTFYK
jgi:hypothetical protein